MDVKGTIPAVVSLLKDRDRGVRSAAASAIGEFFEQRKISLLVHFSVFIINFQPTSSRMSGMPSQLLSFF
jgi:hypothetical protein